jgi:hypothetical protein
MEGREARCSHDDCYCIYITVTDDRLTHCWVSNSHFLSSQLLFKTLLPTRLVERIGMTEERRGKEGGGGDKVWFVLLSVAPATSTALLCSTFLSSWHPSQS